MGYQICPFAGTIINFFLTNLHELLKHTIIEPDFSIIV